MTETTGATCVTSSDDLTLGHVGGPFPCCEVKEILCVCMYLRVCLFLFVLLSMSLSFLTSVNNCFSSYFPNFLPVHLQQFTCCPCLFLPPLRLICFSLFCPTSPSKSFQVKLVDVPEMGYLHSDRSHGDNIPCDGRGEVWVRGPGVIIGYYKDEEETKAAGLKNANGWLKSGDIGNLCFIFYGPRQF